MASLGHIAVGAAASRVYRAAPQSSPRDQTPRRLRGNVNERAAGGAEIPAVAAGVSKAMPAFTDVFDGLIQRTR